MKRLLTLVTLVLFTTTFSQVGIGTETPEATLHVKGDLIVTNIPQGSVTDSLLVTSNGRVKKIAVTDILLTLTTSCPTLVRLESSSSYLKFKSSSSIPNPTDPLTIMGLSFVSAGTWNVNNTYYFTYSNTSGQNLDISDFIVNFSGTPCRYN